MVPSSADDMLIGVPGDEFHLKLADAGKIEIAPYRTGYKRGVKLVLDQFRNTGRAAGAPLDLRVVLTMCLEGDDEDLVSESMAIEHGLTVRELNWPKEVDGSQVDFTVIPSDDGTLLPRNWPKPYHPIHRAAGDHSVIQSHLIETWAMSWWGFEKDDSAMMVIVDQCGYGPTNPRIWTVGILATPDLDWCRRSATPRSFARFQSFMMACPLWALTDLDVIKLPSVTQAVKTPVFTCCRRVAGAAGGIGCRHAVAARGADRNAQM